MTCKKQSVTFEAFMYLTVPIPKGGNKPTVEVSGVALMYSCSYVCLLQGLYKTFCKARKDGGHK